MKTHDAYAAFRISAYRRYFSGNLVFILGLQMQKVAVGWEIYERTGSALNLGLVGLVQFIPQLAFVAVAGHITDVYNRKHVLMASVGLSAVAAAILAVNAATEGPILLLYSCLFLSGAARAFWMPSRSAFLPRIVPLSIFSNAVSWNTSGFEIASFTGPAVGGFIIGYAGGVTSVYVLNAFVIVGFMILISRIPYKHERPARSALTLQSLSAGARYIWNTKVVLSVMMLDMFGVLLGGATALMPIFARDILQVGARGLGWLMAAPSVGAFTSALIQAHRGPLQRAGRAVDEQHVRSLSCLHVAQAHAVHLHEAATSAGRQVGRGTLPGAQQRHGGGQQRNRRQGPEPDAARPHDARRRHSSSSRKPRPSR